MQEKRSIFPRFYFIGDEDLLEILGQSTNPLVIQSHLKKLFAGIHNVDFDEENKKILAMKSIDGEVVLLSNPVLITENVEVSKLKDVLSCSVLLEETMFIIINHSQSLHIVLAKVFNR